MGHPLSEVTRLLTQVRDILLNESQQVAAQGNWESAKTMMEQAQRADQLREEVAGQPSKRTLSAKTENVELALQMNETVVSKPDSLQETYPRYFVRDDALVKQGLRRQGNDVYEHVVPRERYQEILDILTESADKPKKNRFSIDTIQRRLSCPRYMTYVVVSMLLRQGLLKKASKGSYSFASSETFANEAVKLWNHLKGGNNT